VDINQYFPMLHGHGHGDTSTIRHDISTQKILENTSKKKVLCPTRVSHMCLIRHGSIFEVSILPKYFMFVLLIDSN